MSWKTNARKIPAKRIQAALGKVAETFVTKKMIIRHGKPWIAKDHIRDTFIVDEDGHKTVGRSYRLKRGEYVFPGGYSHVGRGIIGKTVDIRFFEGRGWMIKIDALLRDNSTGRPVIHNGLKISVGGWFPESSLTPSGSAGLVHIRENAQAPSMDEMVKERDERIKRISKMMLG